MSPKYKLTYYNSHGSAEPIRILFKYGNIDFEDIRIDFVKEWPELKPKTPFGVLPILEIDDTIIGETLAICRYVGTIVGLAGNNPLENLKIDSFVHSYDDIRLGFVSAILEKEPEIKQQKFDKLLKETIPFYYGKYEEMIKKNNGYIALDKLTWADIVLAVNVSQITDFFKDKNPLVPFTNCLDLAKRVENIPQIKKWIETRP